jgi:hypothetical protein
MHFTSSAELFQALKAPDPAERRKVLGWVATHSAEAIAFGSVEGEDVLDALFGLVDRDVDFAFWEDVAITIGVFDAPRVTEFFVELLESARTPAAALYAATSLGRRDIAESTERVTAVLIGEDADRAVAAAELLAGAGTLPVDAAVRVAVLEVERDPPPFEEAACRAWARELAGPFALQARDRLEETGAAAAPMFLAHWDDLDDESRAWLIGWTADVAPAEAAALVGLALGGDSAELALAAFGSAAEAGIELETALASRWALEGDTEVRVAAIEAGAEIDVEAVLAEEDADPRLIAAVLRRVTQASRLTGYLGSGAPEVRAVAREQLVAAGPASIEVLRPLVTSDEPEVRAGAVRALLELGDDEWLEQALLR